MFVAVVGGAGHHIVNVSVCVFVGAVPVAAPVADVADRLLLCCQNRQCRRRYVVAFVDGAVVDVDIVCAVGFVADWCFCAIGLLFHIVLLLLLLFLFCCCCCRHVFVCIVLLQKQEHTRFFL